MKVGETLQLIAGILIVIIAAYYATYYLANKKNKRMPGREISVRERFALSKDKMVCVIEANGKSYLVVITNGGATLLDTVESVEYGAAGVERAEEVTPQGYQPNGLIAIGIWKLFNFFRGATKAKTSAAKTADTRREERTFSSVLEETAEPDTVPRGSEYTIRVAREEDAMDEIQRRLKNRMAAGASSDMEEASGDE